MADPLAVLTASAIHSLDICGMATNNWCIISVKNVKWLWKNAYDRAKAVKFVNFTSWKITEFPGLLDGDISCVQFLIWLYACMSGTLHIYIYLFIYLFSLLGASLDFGAARYIMASLQNLPFPISELSWEKLPEVQRHMGVSKGEAFTILCHALGPKESSLKHMSLLVC